MFFNCTIPYNQTVVSDCCITDKDYSPQPPVISADNATAYCTSYNGTGILGCFGDQHFVFPECRLQKVDTSMTVNRSSVAHQRPSSLSALLVVALSLTTLSGVLAAPSSSTTTCRDFFAGQPAEEARTNAERISETGTCGGTSHACRIGVRKLPTWKVTWSAPSGIEVDIDPKLAVEAAKAANDNAYAGDVTLPGLYDTWYFPPESRIYVLASASALNISGTYRKCDNQQEYQGFVLVPRADEFWFKTVGAPENSPGLKDPNFPPS